MQITNVEKISTDISDISASIEEIASTSHDVMTHADKASKEGADAAEIGRIATLKMQNVEKVSKQSVDDITALNDEMRAISKIVNLITDIANQTNLLRGADERDRALYAKLRDYLFRVDDEVTCVRCRRRFEIPSHQSLVFL